MLTQELLFDAFLLLTVISGFIFALIPNLPKKLEGVLIGQVIIGTLLSLVGYLVGIEWVLRFVFWSLGILLAEVIGYWIVGKKPIGYFAFGVIFLLIGFLLGGGTLG